MDKPVLTKAPIITFTTESAELLAWSIQEKKFFCPLKTMSLEDFEKEYPRDPNG